MAKSSKNTITIAIVIIGIAAVLGIKYYMDTNRQDPNSGVKNRVKGNAEAPIQITEFIDFQCPACAAGAQYLKKVMEQKPELIQLTLKYFPLRMHSHGELSSKYAECAARQDKFWPFHDLLIDRQQQWHKLNDAKPAFEMFAKELELDAKKLNSCLSDQTVSDIILAEKEEGKTLGVKSTPTYFINGQITVGLKNLATELAKHLNQQPSQAAQSNGKSN